MVVLDSLYFRSLHDHCHQQKVVQSKNVIKRDFSDCMKLMIERLTGSIQI